MTSTTTDDLLRTVVLFRILGQTVCSARDALFLICPTMSLGTLPQMEATRDP